MGCLMDVLNSESMYCSSFAGSLWGGTKNVTAFSGGALAVGKAAKRPCKPRKLSGQPVGSAG